MPISTGLRIVGSVTPGTGCGVPDRWHAGVSYQALEGDVAWLEVDVAFDQVGTFVRDLHGRTRRH